MFLLAGGEVAMSSAYSFFRQFPLPARPRLQPVEAPPAPKQHAELQRVRDSLAAVALKVTSGSELLRALDRERRTEAIPTTVPVIDRLLGGGIVRGKLVELAGKRSTGRFSTVLSTLASVTSTGEAAALVDLGDHFDPQIAESAGVDLRRLLWVRPQKLKDAVAGAEMSLTTGFQLVVLDLGLSPIRGRGRVPEAAWVRLARAAESHGGALLVSAPYPISRTASEAVISAHRARAQWQGTGKTPRLLLGTSSTLTLEKHRHIRAGTMASMAFSVSERITSS
jgi:hypothetical protein